MTNDTEVKDVTGKRIKALQVLEISFKCLIDEVSRIMKTQGSFRLFNKYVIVVPSHFDQNMQDFIRKAAEKSGMPQSSLAIVLETEAVFFYHQCLQARAKNDVNPVRVGKKHLVAVLGDEISTVTVNKKCDDGLSDEVLQINKGPWGIQTVLTEFKTFLKEILGEERMQKFQSEYRCDFKDLLDWFFIKYNGLRENGDDIIRLNIPCSMVELFEDTVTTLEEAIHLSKYADKVRFRQSRFLFWTREEFVKFGKTVIKRAIELIKTVLSDHIADVDTILLAGVLSENVIVQNTVKESFSTKHVVMLNSSAELRGAVYLGHVLSMKI